MMCSNGSPISSALAAQICFLVLYRRCPRLHTSSCSAIHSIRSSSTLASREKLRLAMAFPFDLPFPLPTGRGSSSDVSSAAVPAAGSAGGADSSESAAWTSTWIDRSGGGGVGDLRDLLAAAPAAAFSAAAASEGSTWTSSSAAFFFCTLVFEGKPAFLGGIFFKWSSRSQDHSINRREVFWIGKRY